MSDKKLRISEKQFVEVTEEVTKKSIVINSKNIETVGDISLSRKIRVYDDKEETVDHVIRYYYANTELVT